MYLQEILEVAVGLVFLWLVLSIATMQILEWLRSIARRRAVHLQETIGKMLADPALSEKFYKHPLIQGLSTGRQIKLPSYIPAQQFAMVLFDVVTTANTEASLIRQGLDSLRNTLETMEKTDKNEAAKAALDSLVSLAQEALATDAGSALADEAMKRLKEQIETYTKDHPDFQQEIKVLMAGVEGKLKEIKASAEKIETKNNTLTQLYRGIMALGAISPALKKTLSTLLTDLDERAAAGEDAIAQARTNVSKWFDDSMERLSGSFKRRTLLYSGIIGIVLAGWMNVDSIAVAKYMWVEPAVRQVLIEKAADFELNLPQSETDPANAPEQAPEEGSEIKDPVQAMDEFRAQFAGLTLPLGWRFNKVELLVVTDENGNAMKDDAGKDIVQQCVFNPVDPEEGDKGMRREVFGILWRQECLRPDDTKEDTNGWNWFWLKLGGLIISGLATVQGAPFWFDVLKKLVNVRGSGANPAEKEGGKQ